jgi:hypothetical protein
MFDPVKTYGAYVQHSVEALELLAVLLVAGLVTLHEMVPVDRSFHRVPVSVPTPRDGDGDSSDDDWPENGEVVEKEAAVELQSVQVWLWEHAEVFGCARFRKLWRVCAALPCNDAADEAAALETAVLELEFDRPTVDSVLAFEERSGLDSSEIDAQFCAMYQWSDRSGWYNIPAQWNTWPSPAEWANTAPPPARRADHTAGGSCTLA